MCARSSTTRAGGVSRAPWAGLNLGRPRWRRSGGGGANRQRLRAGICREPLWLSQVHGTRCVDAGEQAGGEQADAAFTRQRGGSAPS
jgi:copper oxidase (laccase) domain-containing protein